MPHYLSNIILILSFCSLLLYVNTKYFKLLNISLFFVFIHFLINRILYSLISDNIGNGDEYVYPYLSKILTLGVKHIVDIDVGTSGPFNSAIMYLPALYNLDINVITSRIIAFFILILTIIVVYKILLVINKEYAPIYIIPILIFYGSGSVSYHSAYTSEFLPTLLIVYSIYTYMIFDKYDKVPIINLSISSIILPLSIFCKLQVAPLALTVWLFIVALSFKKSLNIFIFVVLLSTLTFISFVYFYYVYNSLDYFYISYYKNNIMRTDLLLSPGILDDLKYLTSMSILNIYYLIFILAVIFNFLNIRIFSKQSFWGITIFYNLKNTRNFSKQSIFGITIFMVTIFIILFPKWNFDHYLHYLIMIIPIVFLQLNFGVKSNE